MDRMDRMADWWVDRMDRMMDRIKRVYPVHTFLNDIASFRRFGPDDRIKWGVKCV